MSIDSYRHEWITALESGKYAQTVGILRDKDGYCCLGVAAEIFGVPLNEQAYKKIRELLGITHGQQCMFTEMNDNRRKFSDIALHARQFFNIY